MTVKLKSNLCIGPINIFPNFWHWWVTKNVKCPNGVCKMVLYRGTIFRVSYDIVTNIFVFPQMLPCLAGVLPVTFSLSIMRLLVSVTHDMVVNTFEAWTKLWFFLQASITWTYDGQYVSPGLIELTHWGRDKMDAISQTILLKIFIEWKR